MEERKFYLNRVVREKLEELGEDPQLLEDFLKAILEEVVVFIPSQDEAEEE